MYTHNLLLVHNAGFQALSDWREIAALIRARAPDIEVRILTAEEPRDPLLEVWQESRPSLVVSPRPLEGDYVPRGGTVICGGFLGKLAEGERLAAAGVPVPPTWEMGEFLKAPPPLPDDALLVVKPNGRGRGIGLHLMRAADVKARGRAMMPGGGRRLVVQPFIDQTFEGRPANYRVLTFLGRPLLCVRYSWPKARGLLEEIATHGGTIAANYADDAVRDIMDPPGVVDLARKAASAFPDRPVLGIDIICENGTGHLFVLEVNSGGRVWHLSSDRALSVTGEDYRARLYAQFGALSIAADALVEETRKQGK